MKPALSLAAFALLLSHRSAAQAPVVSKVLPKITFGVKLGADFRQLNGTDWINTYRAGITGGAFVALTKKKIGLQVEALLSSVKNDYRFPPGYTPPGYATPLNSPPFVLPISARLLYLDIPVLAEYKVARHLWLQAGPQFSQLVSAKNDQGADIKSNFKSTDFGGVLGLQAMLPLHLTVSARYILGFSDIDNIGQGTWNNRSIQLAVGLRLL